MKNNIKRIVAFVCMLALTIGSVTILNPANEVKATEGSATTGVTPVYLPGFKHVTLENFNIPKEVTYGEDKYVQLKDNDGTTPVMGNLDKTLLSLKVDFTYESGDRAALMFGGNGWNKGFAFSPNNSGSAVGIINYFHENSPMNDDAQKYQPGVLQAAKVNEALGRTDFTFLEPFTLQVSFEYTTEGADTYLTLVFYINGKQIQVDNRTNGTSGNFGPSLKMKVTNSMTNHGNYIGYRKGDGGTLKVSSVVPENDTLTQFTWSDFVDATGATAGDKTFQATNQDAYVPYQLDGYTSELPSSGFLAKLRFQGAGEENRISYASTQSGEGLHFYVTSQDEFRLDTSGIGRVELALVDNGITFNKTIAGVESFINQEFEFKITTEFADYDGSGIANDVQFGFYFNGTLYNGQYFYAYDCQDAFGTYLKVHAQTAAITIRTMIQAVYLPGFKHVTLENFNMSEGTYTESQYAQLKDNNGLPVTGNHDKTLLSLNVDFTYTSGAQRCSPFVFGGNAWNKGFGFTPNSSGSAVGIIDWFNSSSPMTDAATYQPGVLQASSVNTALGRTDFSFHEEFILQVSFEYTTEGNETYLTLTFYVNGEQIEIDDRQGGTSGNFGPSLKMKVTNSMTNHGSYIGFDKVNQNGTLKMSSIVAENDKLTSITWSDFTSTATGEAAENHVFEAGSSSIAYRFINENVQKMADTAFEAKVTFSGAGTGSRIMYAGTQNWYGLFLYALEDGNLRLETNETNSPQLGLMDRVFTFQKATVGGENFTFLNKEFTLKITTEYGDYDGDADANDVQLGFYFNGKLYNNQYMYGYDCKDAFGNYLNVYANSANITVKSIGATDESQGPGDDQEPGGGQEPETLQPDNSFQKLTFSHFNVSDGIYSYAAGEPSLRVLEKTEKSLDEALFSGDVLLAEGKKMNIRYGGSKAEQGLMFEVRGDGKIHLVWLADSGNEYILTGIDSSKAQTDLFGDWLNLKISTEIVDADNDGQENDIQLGLWFNNIAYNNSYIIVRDKAHLLGSYFSIACQEEGSSVQVRSIPEWMDPVNPDDIVKINESFKKITFSHLAIEDGTYSYVAGERSLRVLGKMKTSVNETVFSGDVLLAEGKKLNIRYGGIKAEHGLMFEVTEKGTINLVWIATSGNEYIVTGITPTKAKTDLFGDWLNLKISTEIVDADKDGQKNDIRMAIWFNDIAYNNRYIIIRDKADLLGSYFSIACQEEGAFVQVRSIPELIEPFDYAWYGLTEAWEETLLNTAQVAAISVGGSKTSASPTGDITDVVIPVVALTISATGLLGYIFMKRKEKREA